MSKIFVTGSDGLLGSNIIRELIYRNHKVKVLVYAHEPITLKGLPIEIVHGDITKAQEVIDASADCEYFINVAAITDMWPTRHPKYFAVNVKGTENAIEAVLKNKMKRLVQIGSASSFGYGTIEKPGDETSAFKSAKYKVDYIESKKLGQEKVIEAVKKRGLDAVVVCPTFMIGPYDSKPSSGAMIIAIAKGNLPGYSSGGKNWVCVKDVAQAVCNALTMGESGETYIAGGENLTYVQAVKRIAAALGQTKLPKFIVPGFLLKFIGFMGTVGGKLTGKAPQLSYNLAQIACDGHYFSPAKAIRELKMPQTPIEVGVKEAQEWFKNHGYL